MAIHFDTSKVLAELERWLDNWVIEDNLYNSIQGRDLDKIEGLKKKHRIKEEKNESKVIS